MYTTVHWGPLPHIQVLGIHRNYVLGNFLSNIVKEEGGFDYKKAIIDSIIILIRNIPDAKESGLFQVFLFNVSNVDGYFLLYLQLFAERLWYMCDDYTCFFCFCLAMFTGFPATLCKSIINLLKIFTSGEIKTKTPRKNENFG